MLHHMISLYLCIKIWSTYDMDEQTASDMFISLNVYKLNMWF